MKSGGIEIQNIIQSQPDFWVQCLSPGMQNAEIIKQCFEDAAKKEREDLKQKNPGIKSSLNEKDYRAKLVEKLENANSEIEKSEIRRFISMFDSQSKILSKNNNEFYKAIIEIQTRLMNVQADVSSANLVNEKLTLVIHDSIPIPFEGRTVMYSEYKKLADELEAADRDLLTLSESEITEKKNLLQSLKVEVDARNADIEVFFKYLAEDNRSKYSIVSDYLEFITKLRFFASPDDAINKFVALHGQVQNCAPGMKERMKQVSNLQSDHIYNELVLRIRDINLKMESGLAANEIHIFFYGIRFFFDTTKPFSVMTTQAFSAQTLRMLSKIKFTSDALEPLFASVTTEYFEYLIKPMGVLNPESPFAEIFKKADKNNKIFEDIKSDKAFYRNVFNSHGEVKDRQIIEATMLPEKLAKFAENEKLYPLFYDDYGQLRPDSEIKSLVTSNQNTINSIRTSYDIFFNQDGSFRTPEEIEGKINSYQNSKELKALWFEKIRESKINSAISHESEFALPWLNRIHELVNSDSGNDKEGVAVDLFRLPTTIKNTIFNEDGSVKTQKEVDNSLVVNVFGEGFAETRPKIVELATRNLVNQGNKEYCDFLRETAMQNSQYFPLKDEVKNYFSFALSNTDQAVQILKDANADNELSRIRNSLAKDLSKAIGKTKEDCIKQLDNALKEYKHIFYTREIRPKVATPEVAQNRLKQFSEDYLIEKSVLHFKNILSSYDHIKDEKDFRKILSQNWAYHFITKNPKYRAHYHAIINYYDSLLSSPEDTLRMYKGDTKNNLSYDQYKNLIASTGLDENEIPKYMLSPALEENLKTLQVGSEGGMISNLRTDFIQDSANKIEPYYREFIASGGKAESNELGQERNKFASDIFPVRDQDLHLPDFLVHEIQAPNHVEYYIRKVGADFGKTKLEVSVLQPNTNNVFASSYISSETIQLRLKFVDIVNFAFTADATAEKFANIFTMDSFTKAILPFCNLQEINLDNFNKIHKISLKTQNDIEVILGYQIHKNTYDALKLILPLEQEYYYLKLNRNTEYGNSYIVSRAALDEMKSVFRSPDGRYNIDGEPAALNFAIRYLQGDQDQILPSSAKNSLRLDYIKQGLKNYDATKIPVTLYCVNDLLLVLESGEFTDKDFEKMIIKFTTTDTPDAFKNTFSRRNEASYITMALNKDSLLHFMQKSLVLNPTSAPLYRSILKNYNDPALDKNFFEISFDVFIKHITELNKSDLSFEQIIDQKVFMLFKYCSENVDFLDRALKAAFPNVQQEFDEYFKKNNINQNNEKGAFILKYFDRTYYTDPVIDRLMADHHDWRNNLMVTFVSMFKDIDFIQVMNDIKPGDINMPYFVMAERLLNENSRRMCFTNLIEKMDYSADQYPILDSTRSQLVIESQSNFDIFVESFVEYYNDGKTQNISNLQKVFFFIITQSALGEKNDIIHRKNKIKMQYFFNSLSDSFFGIAFFKEVRGRRLEKVYYAFNSNSALKTRYEALHRKVVEESTDADFRVLIADLAFSNFFRLNTDAIIEKVSKNQDNINLVFKSLYNAFESDQFFNTLILKLNPTSLIEIIDDIDNFKATKILNNIRILDKKKFKVVASRIRLDDKPTMMEISNSLYLPEDIELFAYLAKYRTESFINLLSKMRNPEHVRALVTNPKIGFTIVEHDRKALDNYFVGSPAEVTERRHGVAMAALNSNVAFSKDYRSSNVLDLIVSNLRDSDYHVKLRNADNSKYGYLAIAMIKRNLQPSILDSILNDYDKIKKDASRNIPLSHLILERNVYDFFAILNKIDDMNKISKTFFTIPVKVANLEDKLSRELGTPVEVLDDFTGERITDKDLPGRLKFRIPALKSTAIKMQTFSQEEMQDIINPKSFRETYALFSKNNNVAFLSSDLATHILANDQYQTEADFIKDELVKNIRTSNGVSMITNLKGNKKFIKYFTQRYPETFYEKVYLGFAGIKQIGLFDPFLSEMVFDQKFILNCSKTTKGREFYLEAVSKKRKEGSLPSFYFANFVLDIYNAHPIDRDLSQLISNLIDKEYLLFIDFSKESIYSLLQSESILRDKLFNRIYNNEQEAFFLLENIIYFNDKRLSRGIMHTFNAIGNFPNHPMLKSNGDTIIKLFLDFNVSDRNYILGGNKAIFSLLHERPDTFFKIAKDFDNDFIEKNKELILDSLKTISSKDKDLIQKIPESFEKLSVEALYPEYKNYIKSILNENLTQFVSEKSKLLIKFFKLSSYFESGEVEWFAKLFDNLDPTIQKELLRANSRLLDLFQFFEEDKLSKNINNLEPDFIKQNQDYIENTVSKKLGVQDVKITFAGGKTFYSSNKLENGKEFDFDNFFQISIDFCRTKKARIKRDIGAGKCISSSKDYEEIEKNTREGLQKDFDSKPTRMRDYERLNNRLNRFTGRAGSALKYVMAYKSLPEQPLLTIAGLVFNSDPFERGVMKASQKASQKVALKLFRNVNLPILKSKVVGPVLGFGLNFIIGNGFTAYAMVQNRKILEQIKNDPEYENTVKTLQFEFITDAVSIGIEAITLIAAASGVPFAMPIGFAVMISISAIQVCVRASNEISDLQKKVILKDIDKFRMFLHRIYNVDFPLEIENAIEASDYYSFYVNHLLQSRSFKEMVHCKIIAHSLPSIELNVKTKEKVEFGMPFLVATAFSQIDPLQAPVMLPNPNTLAKEVPKPKETLSKETNNEFFDPDTSALVIFNEPEKVTELKECKVVFAGVGGDIICEQMEPKPPSLGPVIRLNQTMNPDFENLNYNLGSDVFKPENRISEIQTTERVQGVRTDYYNIERNTTMKSNCNAPDPSANICGAFAVDRTGEFNQDHAKVCGIFDSYPKITFRNSLHDKDSIVVVKGNSNYEKNPTRLDISSYVQSGLILTVSEGEVEGTLQSGKGGVLNLNNFGLKSRDGEHHGTNNIRWFNNQMIYDSAHEGKKYTLKAQGIESIITPANFDIAISCLSDDCPNTFQLNGKRTKVFVLADKESKFILNGESAAFEISGNYVEGKPFPLIVLNGKVGTFQDVNLSFAEFSVNAKGGKIAQIFINANLQDIKSVKYKDGIADILIEGPTSKIKLKARSAGVVNLKTNDGNIASLNIPGASSNDKNLYLNVNFADNNFLHKWGSGFEKNIIVTKHGMKDEIYYIQTGEKADFISPKDSNLPERMIVIDAGMEGNDFVVPNSYKEVSFVLPKDDKAGSMNIDFSDLNNKHGVIYFANQHFIKAANNMDFFCNCVNSKEEVVARIIIIGCKNPNYKIYFSQSNVQTQILSYNRLKPITVDSNSMVMKIDQENDLKGDDFQYLASAKEILDLKVTKILLPKSVDRVESFLRDGKDLYLKLNVKGEAKYFSIQGFDKILTRRTKDSGYSLELKVEGSSINIGLQELIQKYNKAEDYLKHILEEGVKTFAYYDISVYDTIYHNYAVGQKLGVLNSPKGKFEILDLMLLPGKEDSSEYDLGLKIKLKGEEDTQIVRIMGYYSPSLEANNRDNLIIRVGNKVIQLEYPANYGKTEVEKFLKDTVEWNRKINLFGHETLSRRKRDVSFEDPAESNTENGEITQEEEGDFLSNLLESFAAPENDAESTKTNADELEIQTSEGDIQSTQTSIPIQEDELESKANQAFDYLNQEEVMQRNAELENLISYLALDVPPEFEGVNTKTVGHNKHYNLTEFESKRIEEIKNQEREEELKKVAAKYNTGDDAVVENEDDEDVFEDATESFNTEEVPTTIMQDATEFFDEENPSTATAYKAENPSTVLPLKNDASFDIPEEGLLETFEKLDSFLNKPDSLEYPDSLQSAPKITDKEVPNDTAYKAENPSTVLPLKNDASFDIPEEGLPKQFQDLEKAENELLGRFAEIDKLLRKDEFSTSGASGKFDFGMFKVLKGLSWIVKNTWYKASTLPENLDTKEGIVYVNDSKINIPNFNRENTSNLKPVQDFISYLTSLGKDLTNENIRYVFADGSEIERIKSDNEVKFEFVKGLNEGQTYTEKFDLENPFEYNAKFTFKPLSSAESKYLREREGKIRKDILKQDEIGKLNSNLSPETSDKIESARNNFISSKSNEQLAEIEAMKRRHILEESCLLKPNGQCVAEKSSLDDLSEENYAETPGGIKVNITKNWGEVIKNTAAESAESFTKGLYQGMHSSLKNVFYGQDDLLSIAASAVTHYFLSDRFLSINTFMNFSGDITRVVSLALKKKMIAEQTSKIENFDIMPEPYKKAIIRAIEDSTQYKMLEKKASMVGTVVAYSIPGAIATWHLVHLNPYPAAKLVLDVGTYVGGSNVGKSIIEKLTKSIFSPEELIEMREMGTKDLLQDMANIGGKLTKAFAGFDPHMPSEQNTFKNMETETKNEIVVSSEFPYNVIGRVLEHFVSPAIKVKFTEPQEERGKGQSCNQRGSL